MSVSYTPEGYATITPYLIVDGAADAIFYYKEAFGAEEVMRMPMGDRIGHAEIRIGDSLVMLADEHEEMGLLGPESRGGATSSLMIYVEEVDTIFADAVEAGGTEERAVQDQFYGDRSGTLVDPFGHRWTIATHVEDVAPEELQRRMAEQGARKQDAKEETGAEAEAEPETA
jgi:PhnB protein